MLGLGLRKTFNTKSCEPYISLIYVCLQVMVRLGLRNTFNPKRCSMHFLLDCANPEHNEVAKKLVEMALKVTNKTLPNPMSTLRVQNPMNPKQNPYSGP